MSQVEQVFVGIVGTNPLTQGLTGGLVIAAANMIGAVLIWFWRRPGLRALNTALGFAAGVMLSASFTSLILPGIERGGVAPVLIGMLLGALVLSRAEGWVPFVQSLIVGKAGKKTRAASDIATGPGPVGRDTHRGSPDQLSPSGSVATTTPNPAATGTLFFIIAITLHNMPEGLAVGVGFGSGDIGNALALMFAIGIQNIPEGLAVSVSARGAGLGNRNHAVFTGVRAGLVEIPLAVFGATVVAVAAPLLPYAMGFAAGGMLYAISHEIIPQTHHHGRQRHATLGLIVGAVLMLYLDVSLG